MRDRTLPSGSWNQATRAPLGAAHTRCGEWDLSRTELERALVDAVDPSDRTLLLNNLVNVLAASGEPYEAGLAELEGLLAALPEEGGDSLLLESTGWIAFDSGRPADGDNSSPQPHSQRAFIMVSYQFPESLSEYG